MQEFCAVDTSSAPIALATFAVTGTGLVAWIERGQGRNRWQLRHSAPESFGRTVLEALSLGRPTVGFAHGGVGEILEMLYPHGIVRALDEDHLYQVTRRLLDAAPRVSGTHPFTNAQMIARILTLYEELVAAGARS